MTDINSFSNMVRSFLANNPRLLETLVTLMYGVADDLSKIHTKAISNGKYMTPHTFKQKLVEKMIKKLGYQMEDIPELCYQGRGEELLLEIDKMEKTSLPSSSTPSRRILPIASNSMKEPSKRLNPSSSTSSGVIFEELSTSSK